MVRLSLPRLSFGNGSIPAGGGVLAACLAAGFFVLLPDWRLEQLVEASGLPQLVSFAQPPLGNTARLLLAVAAAAGAGAIAWSALFLLVGPGGVFDRPKAAADRPIVRRADAHPDAPPRHPLTAAELGAPPPAERDLPADLDQPLAAFDPAAIPEEPREAARAPAAIPSREEPAPAEAAAMPIPAPMDNTPAPVDAMPARTPSDGAPLPRNDAPPPSIAALLERLERGARRR